MLNSIWPISSYVKQNYKNIECLEEIKIKDLYHDLNNLPINNNPIEKNLHYIWIKSHKVSTNSNEIDEDDFNNFLDQDSKIYGTKECLNIDFYQNNKQNFNCANGNYFDYNQKDLLHKIFWINDEAFIEKKNYGAMVDYLKYEVVKNFGGVALDLNFKIVTTKLFQLLDIYSLIGVTTQGRGEITSENYFLAAHAKHPILNAMSDFLNTELLLEGNLNTMTTWGQWDRVIRENIDENGGEDINKQVQFVDIIIWKIYILAEIHEG